MSMSTRKLTMMAMLTALAYIVMVVVKIPLIPSLSFLRYDPKDVIIALSGFIYGPLSALIIAVAVSFVEMVTVSATGPIGLFMNAISSSLFACSAAFIYNKIGGIKGVILGLLLGIILNTAFMLLLNYLVAPYYMDVTHQQVAAMLIPIFLPFNLIKGTLNAIIILVIHKPVKTFISYLQNDDKK